MIQSGLSHPLWLKDSTFIVMPVTRRRAGTQKSPLILRASGLGGQSNLEN